MSHIIEALYCTAALFAIGACVPQIRQLVKTKASDELSIITWSVWTLTQCITLLYVFSIGNYLMVVVNIAWVSFYSVMLALILRYRHAGQMLDTLTPGEVKA